METDIREKIIKQKELFNQMLNACENKEFTPTARKCVEEAYNILLTQALLLYKLQK